MKPGWTTADVISAWEAGAPLTAVWHGPVLVAAAQHISIEDAAALPLGRREAALLDAREAAFGTQLSAWSECPLCNSKVEMRFTTTDLRSSAATDSGKLFCEVHGTQLLLRHPDSNDLAAVATESSPDAARRELFQRCVVQANLAESGDRIAAVELGEEFCCAASAALAEADPQADIQLELTCPECGHGWEAPFDVAGYFWTEIASQARRLLGEIHELAAAYGWSEGEILSLSDNRRAAYLELIRG